MFDIQNWTDRLTIPNHPPKHEMFDRKVYVKIAQYTIYKLTKNNNLIRSEDIITNISTAIMIADWRWDNITNRMSYLFYSAKNAVCSMLKRYITHKKKNIQSLSFPDKQIQQDYVRQIEDKRYSHEVYFDKKDKQFLTTNILNDKILTEKQKTYLIEHFFNNKSLAEIGREYDVTRQGVYFVINYALSNLKIVYKNKAQEVLYG